MKVLIFAAIFCCAIICVIGECSSANSCDNCVKEDGCGWCAATQQCLNGTKAGPLSGVCVGNNWEFQTCTPCANFRDCQSCFSRDTDCFWCQESNNGMGACKEIGFAGCDYAASCPCDVYGSCTECVNQLACKWCEAGDQCVSNNATCLGPQPVYNFTTQCPCAANHDCDNCLATYGCDWCTTGECAPNCDGPNVLNCNVYCNEASATCDGCVTTDGCAWCSLTHQCVDATTSSCNYAYSCPNCNISSYCDTCLSVPECQWCLGSNECKPLGTQCNVATNCAAYCAQQPTCSSCSGTRGCAWCDDINSCVDINTATCFMTHTCNIPPPPPVVTTGSNAPVVAPHCKFDGGAFVGGMFFVVGLLIIGIGGYVFYRWRTGKRTRYTEL